MTTERLKEIRKNLPKRWRLTIQAATGYTITYISFVISGVRPSNTQAAQEIMQVAERLAEKNKAAKEEFKKKVQAL